MKFLKGFFILVSVICIAFTAFFAVASATGHIGTLTKLEAGIAKLAGGSDSPAGQGATGTESTISMLTKTYGLSTSQAGQLVDIAGQLGVDTDDPAEMNRFIANNAGNSEEIKEVAELYQSGAITEAQAKKLLAGIVDV